MHQARNERFYVRGCHRQNETPATLQALIPCLMHNILIYNNPMLKLFNVKKYVKIKLIELKQAFQKTKQVVSQHE